MPGEHAPHGPNLFDEQLAAQKIQAAMNVQQQAPEHHGRMTKEQLMLDVGMLVARHVGVRIVEKAETTIGAQEEAQRTWNANTPFNSANAERFGGEQGRQAAVTHTNELAGQSLQTGVYYNAPHKRLGKMLKKGEIGEAAYNEASGAIMTAVATTNPKKLEQVHDAQAKKIAKRHPEATFLPVTSTRTETGDGYLAGADMLAARVHGVGSRQELHKTGAAIRKQHHKDAHRASHGQAKKGHEVELVSRISNLPGGKQRAKQLIQQQQSKPEGYKLAA